MAVTLYHYPGSLCSQKVRLALAEKGVVWQSRIVDIGPAMENYEPWYCRINPRMVVPTLVDDGQVVTDSAQIVRYIDLHLEGQRLLPADPADLADVEAWIDRQDGFPFRELSYARMPSLLRPLRSTIMRRRLLFLRKHMAAAPELSEHYKARIEDVEQWRAMIEDPGQVSELESRLNALMDELEASLDKQRFVAGERYSLADTVWTVIVARVSMLLGHESVGSRPAVAAWYGRMKQRPSFEEAGIWEEARVTEILPIIAPFVLPRLAVASLVLVGLIWAAALLFGS